MTNPPQDPAEIQALATKIYDALMEPIEPDLTSGMLPLLDDVYAGESPEAHAARMQRYEEAYKSFDAKSAEAMTEIKTIAHKLQQEALAKKEQADRQVDNASIERISTQFA